MLELAQLEDAVRRGAIDTVVVAFVDMQGRLMGKRVDGEYFLEHAEQGVDVCSSLMTLDMESDITPGYDVSNIDTGYGDFALRFDLATLRRIPWHEATALVLGDLEWHDGPPVNPAPRAVLKHQVERARVMGFEPAFGSELEFFVCRETYDEAHENAYARITAAGRYVTDGHLLAPGFDEPLVGQLRRRMRAAGIPVEASKAEAWAGQHEVTFSYADPVTTADNHAIFKHGAKEIAFQNGCSITFMAKPDHRWQGSSCHVHQSLWVGGQNVFAGESEMFRHYLAGQLACLKELGVFIAPTVNSYKRFAENTWAGTTVTWAHDNRTTGFRVIGSGDSFRVEARIPGADVNPYLAPAALLAAGLYGIEHELPLPAPCEGNAYVADVERFHSSLREAIAALERGTMARAAFGDDVIDHYLNYARFEQRLFDQVVTDYEREDVRARVIEPFRNYLPVKIRFGKGVLADLPGVLAEEGCSRPFVVVDELVQSLPSVAAVLEQIGGATLYPKTAGEPTVADVEDAAAKLGASHADAVVAIGGGSVMDTAKAARLVWGQGGPYLRFAAGGVAYEPPKVPLVTIPTTAGTGSEVSGGAVITNQATDTKAGIASPFLRAQHALVDPELTYGLPPGPTMWAGVDALAQSLSAVVVKVRTPIGDAIGLEGTRLAARALPAVVRDGSDRDARSQMACASLLGGLAMNISDCGSEHSIAQAIGGRFHIPHGLTIGLVLAETMDHDRKAVPERFERIADALGEPDDGSGDGSRAVRGVRRILKEIDFPTLRSVGVAEEHVDGLAEAALDDYFISVAPAPWTKADVVAAYRAALAIVSR